DGRFYLAELKGQRRRDVVLLAAGLADEELPRLAVMVGEAFRAQAAFGTLLDVGKRDKAALRGFARAFTERIRLIIDASDRVAHRHMTVLLEMCERAFWRVDRNMGEVRATQPLQLRVQVGKVAPLQQRVIGKIDPG